jgi:hypothetical protein
MAVGTNSNSDDYIIRSGTNIWWCGKLRTTVFVGHKVTRYMRSILEFVVLVEQHVLDVHLFILCLFILDSEGISHPQISDQERGPGLSLLF